MIVSLLAAALAAAPVPKMEPLTPLSDEREAPACAADKRLCVQVAGEREPQLRVLGGPDQAAPLAARKLEGEVAADLWPQAIRLGEGVALVGVKRWMTTGFSGGGGQSADLELFLLKDEKLEPVLTVLLSGSLIIRACFSEEDMKARRDACHDEYDFKAELAVDPQPTSGPPRLVLMTNATTFPNRRSRSSDSTAEPPLRQKDLVHARDETCSYRRVFSFDSATRRYEPDAPLPDCSQYSVDWEG